MAASFDKYSYPSSPTTGLGRAESKVRVKGTVRNPDLPPSPDSYTLDVHISEEVPQDLQNTHDENGAHTEYNHHHPLPAYQLDGARAAPSPARQKSSVRSGTSMNGSGFVPVKKLGITDFFSLEVFQTVLHNPTTAHRFLRFCQTRLCGENMEFLQMVDTYHRLLGEVTHTLSSIHRLHTSPEAPRQINVGHSVMKGISSNMREITQRSLPSLESIFSTAQDHVEKLLAMDIYPRFVKHQITASAAMALADHRERYQGLGDCFCLTDPNIADNPIVYASDGFVSVTGYSRHDIIPRNCRFLQGERTDPMASKRLKFSIENCEETVELLLNYRKTGEPFWNLLYVAPLLNEQGEVAFFLGGQINCNTTIHSYNDVLRVLSISDEESLEFQPEESLRHAPASLQSRRTMKKSSFFRSWRKGPVRAAGEPKIVVKEEVGMGGELLGKIGRLNFKTQVETFYTAYSKYLVMPYSSPNAPLPIEHFSPGVIDMLCLHLPNGQIAPIFHKDIFKVLSEYSSTSSSTTKALRNSVRDALKVGNPVSVEIGLLTGYEEVRVGGGWRWGRGREERDGEVGEAVDTKLRRREERYVSHWTPLKDEEGRVRWVVLTIAPKV